MSGDLKAMLRGQHRPEDVLAWLHEILSADDAPLGIVIAALDGGDNELRVRRFGVVPRAAQALVAAVLLKDAVE